MDYILEETSNKKKSKKKKSEVPFAEHMDVEADKVDDLLYTMNNESPKLHLFFKGNTFELGEVAGDNCIIHLQANDVIKAMITFLACYFVFHIGYPQIYANFLGFMQRIMFDQPYECKNAGYIALVDKFYKELDKQKEAKQIKKHAINA